jgi:hypothetical protein
MKLDNLHNYFNKEVDVFIAGGVYFRGILKRHFAASSGGPLPIDNGSVTIEPTGSLSKLFGITTIKTDAIVAIRQVLGDDK